MTEEVRNLLAKPRWTDPTDLYIGEIYEYDMSDGGFSIIQEESLLPQAEINRLAKLEKGFPRNEAVGKLKYSKNPEIRDTGKKLERLFGKYRILFGEANDIRMDEIFSIKRDAVFLKRYASQTSFGDYIIFKEKHEYDIYFLLGVDELVTNFQSRHRTYEVYYNTFTDDIAIKGIKDELIEKYHMEFIVAIIKKYLRYVARFDYVGATKYIVQVIDDYKFFRLPMGCYRDFDDTSSYKVQVEGKSYEVEEADKSIMELIDIRYNFNHVLVPMLNMASLGIGKGTQSGKRTHTNSTRYPR